MPCCSVLQCKNKSKTRNVQNGGVSYHRFPKDPHVKENWIDATGRVDWMPTKFSTICSEHFLEHDFMISKKGLKYTKSTAIPTLKIFKFLNQQQDFDNIHSPPLKKKSKTCKDFRQIPNNNVTASGSSNSSPTKNKLKRQLIFCEEKIKRQHLKIKRLQANNRRLKKKCSKIEDVLKSLEEKFSMCGENLECLKNTNLEVRELMARTVKNTES